MTFKAIENYSRIRKKNVMYFNENISSKISNLSGSDEDLHLINNPELKLKHLTKHLRKKVYMYSIILFCNI